MEIISILWIASIALITAYMILVILYLLLDNRDPQSTMSWVIVLLLLPLIGLVLYIFFGKNWRRWSKKTINERAFVERELSILMKNILENHKSEIKNLKNSQLHPQTYELISLLNKNSGAVLTSYNQIKLFNTGKEKFESLIGDLKKAKKSIHLEYFIWRSDSLTKKIHEILIKKAKEGVEIRIIFDAMGGFFFKRKDKKELKAAGIKLHAFSNKLRTFNYRNHRKIAVIDGEIAYMGGMNMGVEYIRGIPGKFESWRDAHLRITGEAVRILQGIFVGAWYHSTNEKLFDKKYFPETKKSIGKVPIQITTSGPDSKWESIKQLFFSLINSVDKYIYIQSPYFVPDQSVLMALKTAALRGLDVRLMVAGKPDKKIPYWAAYTFFKDLLMAGVKIYHYQKGFLHSKTLVFDDLVSSVGTANLDSRSFSLNYEINALIFDRDIASQLKKEFLKDQKFCKTLNYNEVSNMGIMKRLRNSLARLFAPLL